MAKKGGKKKSQVEVVMHEYKEGRLRSSSGKKVTSRKQALRIALEEERASKERGSSKREWRGRTRMRPNLPKGRKRGKV